MAVSQTFLVLVTLTVLRSAGQESCRTHLSLDLSDVFLMMRLGSYVLGRRDTDAEGHFHHAVSKVRLNMAYHCWRWPGSPGWGGVVRFFHCKVTLFYPLSMLCSVEGLPCVQPTLQEWGIKLHLLQGRIPTLIIWSSKHSRWSFLPILNLFYHLFI